MAHPYKGHSQNAVAHRRANKILRGNEYASGGTVAPDCATRASGGRISAGAESGVGRLQKAHGAGKAK